MDSHNPPYPSAPPAYDEIDNFQPLPTSSNLPPGYGSQDHRNQQTEPHPGDNPNFQEPTNSIEKPDPSDPSVVRQAELDRILGVKRSKDGKVLSATPHTETPATAVRQPQATPSWSPPPSVPQLVTVQPIVQPIVQPVQTIPAHNYSDGFLTGYIAGDVLASATHTHSYPHHHHSNGSSMDCGDDQGAACAVAASVTCGVCGSCILGGYLCSKSQRDDGSTRLDYFLGGALFLVVIPALAVAGLIYYFVYVNK